jgi:hypothetical protein
MDRLLAQASLSNPVETSINAFLIKDGAHRILIDTGAGDFFGPGGGKLVASLKATCQRPLARSCQFSGEDMMIGLKVEERRFLTRLNYWSTLDYFSTAQEPTRRNPL